MCCYTGGMGTKESEGSGRKELTKGRVETKEEREGRSSKEKGRGTCQKDGGVGKRA